jgi:hypothetical protein
VWRHRHRQYQVVFRVCHVSPAAKELHTFIRQSGGVTLPMMTEQSGSQAMRMYVGRSAYADALVLNE